MTSRFSSFLAQELTTFPGRADALARYMASLTVVMLFVMAADIPMLSLAIIMIFFASKENTVLTALAGRSMAIGMTIVLVNNMVFMPFYIEYPLFRTIMMCLLNFVGMYLYRVCRFGSIGYIVAIFSGVAMSNYGITLDPEIITRQEMYLWAVSLSAVAVTVLINFTVMPAWPRRMVRMETQRQLNTIMKQLDARIKGETPPSLHLPEVERGMQAVRKHFNAALAADRQILAERERHLARIETVERLLLSAVQLSRMAPTPVLDDFKVSIHALKGACAALNLAVIKGSDFTLYDEPVFPSTHHQALASELHEMVDALSSLSLVAAEEKTQAPAPVAAKPPLFVADAFTNPVYVRFACKTVLATLVCYLFYTIAHWPGIRTSMTTCLILALPGLGAVSQKAILRISGTLIGSVISLFAAVFILPHLESVAGFLLLSLAVIGIGGWVAAGSVRINYAGLQIVYAYSMSSCEFYYPSGDLLEMRDRLVGILIGIVVSTVIYTLLWPERDSDSLPKLLARMMRALSGLLYALGTESLPGEKQRLIASARAYCWSTLGACREMQARVVLEPDWRYSRGDFTPFSRSLLVQSQKMMLDAAHLQALFASSAVESSETAEIGVKFFRQSAEMLKQYAEIIETGSAVEALVELPDPGILEKACAWAPSGSACGELPQTVDAFTDLLMHMNPSRKAEGKK